MNKKAIFRIPIFIKLLVFSCFLVVSITSAIGFFVLDIQKSQFKKQLTEFGKSLMHIMEKNAPDKILAEEDLALFKLVKDIAANEQIVEVSITDAQGIIIAHSDIDKVNKPYVLPVNLIETEKWPRDLSIHTFNRNEAEYLLLKIPLSYQDVHIGQAQIIISQQVIAESIAKSKQIIMAAFVGIIFFAFLISLAFSVYFATPIKILEKSVNEFGTGNYTHRNRIARNDEMGDLAEAFNRMAQDIELKERIKDSFGRYLAPEIVEMIVKNPSEHWFKANSKDATVLFTDIRGFTALSENKEPAVVVDILNEHFTQITDTIIKHGGHIDKFVGDAAMAVFGITRDTQDHALDAVNAAFEIMQIIESQAQKTMAERTVLRIGIGINTGSMVAGNVGSRKKMEYTVIGDNVNIASRLTALAEPGEILVTGKTFDCIRNISSIKATQKGQMVIKGRKNKIRVFQLNENQNT